MSDRELLDAMRAAPDDDGPRLVYADWLLARGDERGELIVLEQRDRAGTLTKLDQIERLLDLTSMHGFLRLPDDPCADIFQFAGGGAFPTQYFLDHEGHNYYLRWRYGFSIEVDDATVLECDLEVTTTNEFTYRETNVILAIVSEAIRGGRPLSELAFPDGDGFLAHPHYRPGRCPLYGFPEMYDPSRRLELRDFPRWYRLWNRRQKLLGAPVRPWSQGCQCGVEGMTCGVAGCDLPRA